MILRKIASMTMLISGFVLIVNSIVLYVVPEGRVAHWANWLFMGLTKEEWSNQHLTVGVLFLIAGLLHVYYNWKAVISYLKNKMRKMSIFTPAFLIAFILTGVVVMGTYLHVPPMSSLVNIGNSLKQAGARKYGTPPYGRAELSSLEAFARKEQLDLEKSIALLEAADIRFENIEQNLEAIATSNRVSPQHLYEIIKSARIKQTGRETEKIVKYREPAQLPETPPPGFGRKTIYQACTELGLDSTTVTNGLEAIGISATSETTIKELVASYNKTPQELYAIILESSDTISEAQE